jgi:transposase
MGQHLQQISQVTPTGRHAVVIMDGAGWHIDDIAFAFDNITLVRLPAYSPELNPVEQIWQWLRQNE